MQSIAENCLYYMFSRINREFLSDEALNYSVKDKIDLKNIRYCINIYCSLKISAESERAKELLKQN